MEFRNNILLVNKSLISTANSLCIKPIKSLQYEFYCNKFLCEICLKL